MNLSKKKFLVPALVILSALLIRLTVLHFVWHIDRDSLLYIELIKKWQQSGYEAFLKELNLFHSWMPWLPLFLMRMFAAFSSDIETAIRCGCIIFGCTIPLFGYLITMEISGKNCKWAFFTGIFLAFHHNLISYSVMPLRDTFYISFAGAAIWFFLRAVRSGKITDFIFMFIGITLAFCCRYEAAELLLLFTAAIFLEAYRKKIISKKTFLLIIACVATAAAATAGAVLMAKSSLNNSNFTLYSRLLFYIQTMLNFTLSAENFENVFFKRMVRGIGEIFAIGSLIAAGLILFRRKHRQRLYAFFWFAVIFMLLWRTAIGIKAGRYAALLIYPAVILTGFVAVRGREYLRLAAIKFPSLRKFTWFRKFYFYAVFTGVAAGSLTISICKIENNDFSRKLYAVFLREYKKNPGIMFYTRPQERIRTAYYTGLVIGDVLEDGEKNIYDKICRTFVRSNVISVIYFQHPSHLVDTSVWQNSVLPSDASFEILHSEYVNRKKRNKHLIIKYTPPSTVRMITGQAPALADNKANMLTNGGMEIVDTHKNSSRLPLKSVNDSFYRGKEYRFPRHYQFAFVSDKPPIPRLTAVTNGALRGKYSLKISAGSDGVLIIPQLTLGNGEYRASILIRGKTFTWADFKLIYPDQDKNPPRSTGRFRLPNKNINIFDAVFKINDAVPGKEPKLALYINNGEAVIDEFCLEKLR